MNNGKKHMGIVGANGQPLASALQAALSQAVTLPADFTPEDVARKLYGIEPGEKLNEAAQSLVDIIDRYAKRLAKESDDLLAEIKPVVDESIAWQGLMRDLTHTLDTIMASDGSYRIVPEYIRMAWICYRNQVYHNVGSPEGEPDMDLLNKATAWRDMVECPTLTAIHQSETSNTTTGVSSAGICPVCGCSVAEYVDAKFEYCPDCGIGGNEADKLTNERDYCPKCGKMTMHTGDGMCVICKQHKK